VKKILITTGGSGGHVIPAKIIEEHLRNNFRIYFATDLRGLKYLSSDINQTIIIDTPKFNLSLNLPFKLMKLIYLIFRAILFLKKEKIEKVVSIGGYMSVPVVIAARILRLTILLLEPNLVLGRGNRFFLNFSKKIFCYSNRLSNFPKKKIHKIELIKPLVSKAFYELKKKKDVNTKFCFLISGGSQGAKIFDELIKEVMIDVSKNFSIKVIQQTSLENIENLKNFYDTKNIENKIFNFEEKFINLINMSDLCITRAGATSLAEISILNKPFIAIPLPSAKDNHQMKNAQFYEEMGCCWVLDQRNLNKENLLNIILEILKNKSDLIVKKSNLEKLNFENSWNDVNQKLQRIINEN
jgi:UDP-N-acetylglucosamine--N-acetylmuramyl-(pentapeptide) pyrophosphoryl-undecaprenol N-acetylglucosamine transferase